MRKRLLGREVKKWIASIVAIPMVVGVAGWSGALNRPVSHAKRAIVIGNIETLTGPLASSLDGLEAGIHAWAAWTDAHGGVNGHQVRIITMDDGGSAATSVTDARTLISKDHVVALLDGTDEDSAWGKYDAGQKVPVIADLMNPTPNKYFFNPGTPLIPTGNYGSLQAAHKAGAKSLAFMYCTEVAACSEAVPGVKEAAKKIGLKFAYATGISSSAPNYTAECLAAKAHGADLLDVFDSVTVQLNVASSCAAAGWKFRIVSSDFNFSGLWLENSAVNGAISQMPNFPFTDHSTSATREFQAAMKKYEHKVYTSPEFGAQQASGWAAAAEIGVAIKLAHAGTSGSVRRAQIMKGLLSMRHNTLSGLAPPLTYTGKSNENSDIRCYFVMGIKNRHFVEPDGLHTPCVPKGAA